MPHENIDNLGICSACDGIISILHYANSGDAEVWHCIHCNAIVDHESFGYDKPSRGCRKVRWVGPEGKWVAELPSEHFTIGKLTVYARHPRYA